MMKITNLKHYKNYKKAKLIHDDLETILTILNVSIKTLGNYKKYIPVKDMLENMINNRMLISLHYKKYKDMVNKKGVIDES